MAPAPTRATPAREWVRGHCRPGGHGDAGQRGLPQNLHTRRSGCLGGEGRSHRGAAQKKCSRRAGVHLRARAGRAPAAVADGPQARVGAAETERRAGTWGACPGGTAPDELMALRGRGPGRGLLATTWFPAPTPTALSLQRSRGQRPDVAGQAYGRRPEA